MLINMSIIDGYDWYYTAVLFGEGNSERQVVGGSELVENTWRETTYVVYTAIIILLSVRWRRPWTGGELCEGWCELGNVRSRENAQDRRRRVGRARCGGCKREGSTGRRCRAWCVVWRWGGGQTSPSVGRRPARRGRSRLFLRVRSSVRITRSARSYAPQRDNHAAYLQTIIRRFSVYF